MRRFLITILTVVLFASVNFKTFAEENIVEKETELNFYTGLFDFSDHKQKAGLLGIQHQNEDLFRKSFIGLLSPITGGFITESNAFY